METNIQEIWKDVPEWEGLYQASNLGRIKSLSRISQRTYHGNLPVIEKIMTPVPDKDGYLRTIFRKPGKKKMVIIHRLVMQAFVGVSHLPVDHINGVKDDNRLDNLRYCTARENNHFKVKRLHNNKSVGVNKLRGRWQASIGYMGQQFYLGFFKTEKEGTDKYTEALKNIEVYGHPKPELLEKQI